MFLVYRNEIKKLWNDPQLQNETKEMIEMTNPFNVEESFDDIYINLYVDNFSLLNSCLKNSDIQILNLMNRDGDINWKTYFDDFIKNEENNRCVRCIESSCFQKLKYQSSLFDIYFCCNCGSGSPCLVFNIKPGSCKLLL